MHYLIDGYNLLFRTLRARGSEDLRYERERLVVELGIKLKIAGIDGALIFDSYHQIGPRERFYQQGLDVHYTDEKQTADEYILEWLRLVKRPQDYTVVTSDRGLARRAACKGARVQTVEGFKAMLGKLYLKKLHQPQVMELKPLPTLVKISPEKTETSQERYERIFEERQEGEVPVKEVKKENPRKKIPEKEISSEQREEDDFERWLRIFGNHGPTI
jgi:predicted RNA-binding protein with PIN domain